MFLLEQGPFSFDSQLSSGPRTQEVLLLGSARCAFEPELTLHRSNCPPSQSLSFPATIQTRGDKSRLRGVELWGLAYARRPLGGFSPLLVLHLALLGERATGASFSLFFSPEESQLSHSLPVTHSGGRTKSETSAEAQSFKLLQRTGPGRLQEPPGKTTLTLGVLSRWDMNLGFCYSLATLRAES